MRCVVILFSLVGLGLGARINTNSKTTDSRGNWIFAYRSLNSYARVIDTTKVTVSAPGMKTQWCDANRYGIICLAVPTSINTLTVLAEAPTCGSQERSMERGSYCSDPQRCVMQGTLSGFGQNCPGVDTHAQGDSTDLAYCEQALASNPKITCTDVPPPTTTTTTYDYFKPGNLAPRRRRGPSTSPTVYDCTTGSGSACKICKDKYQRTATNQCSSCNTGYFLLSSGKCLKPGEPTDPGVVAPGSPGDIDTDSKDGCDVAVEVSGEDERQGAFMGTYVKTRLTPGDEQEGRKIYRNAQKGRKGYLYYWSEHGSWHIGDDYTNNRFAMMSGMFGEIKCPTQAFGWTVVTATGSRVVSSVKIRATSVPTTTTTSTPQKSGPGDGDGEGGDGNGDGDGGNAPDGGGGGGWKWPWQGSGAVSIHSSVPIFLAALMSLIHWQ